MPLVGVSGSVRPLVRPRKGASMTPELLQSFELRCGEVHPVRCSVAIRAMSGKR